MKGPWRALLVQGTPQNFHFLWPDPRLIKDSETPAWLGLTGLEQEGS